MLVLALTLAAFAVQTDTTAPSVAPPDTVEVDEAMFEDVEGSALDTRVRPIFSTSTLYSPSKGVGLGGGVGVDGLLRQGDSFRIEMRLSQRLQGAFGEYVTADPRRVRLFGQVGGAGWTTTRTRFIGHGPESPADAELFLDRVAAEAEARLGWAPWEGGKVLVEPTVRLRYDRLRDFEETVEGGLEEVSDRDVQRLTALVGEDRLGGEAALIGIVDTRDIPSMPSSGVYVQAEAARFQAFDSSDLGFTRVEALAYGFRPALLRLPFIPDRGALFVRFNAVVTRQDGDEPLPWVYLPDLSEDLLVGYPRSEFVGRDALSLGVGARGVIGQAIGAFLVEGVGTALVGAAYDDVFRQFTPRVRYIQDRIEEDGAVPLRPSLAVGLNVRFIDRERPIAGILVGAGPGGVSFASVRLVYGLGHYRPRLR